MNTRRHLLSRPRGSVLAGAAALSAVFLLLGIGEALAQDLGYYFPPHPG